MSRIGRTPIAIPKGVDFSLSDRAVRVKGPKGELTWTLPERIVVEQTDGMLKIEREKDDKQTKAFHGLTRAHLANMVTGVSDGFQKTLQIEGVGYRASMKGQALELTLGFSHPVSYPVPKGIEIQVESPTLLHVRGMDRQQVGQVAAEIRKLRPPEPYKGKGIRYSDERVRRKAGKAGA